MEIWSIEEKVKNIENLFYNKDQARLKIIEKLHNRELDRNHIMMQLGNQRLNVMHVVDDKISAIQYLQQALEEYTPVDELVIQIKCLYHRLKSGRNSLGEEKQILKEIKSAQEHMDKLCAELEAKRWGHWHLREVLTSKESVKNHLDRLYNELQGVSKEQKAYHSKVGRLKKRLASAEKDMSSLRKKLQNTNFKMEKLNEHLEELGGCGQNKLFLMMNYLLYDDN